MWQKHWEGDEGKLRAFLSAPSLVCRKTWTQVQVNDAEWKEQRLYFILKTSCRTADVCNDARRCDDGEGRAATCHWGGWEPVVGCFVSFCQSWLYFSPKGASVSPSTSIVSSLSPSSVQKPQSHIQWRTSWIERVATNVCLLYWILTSWLILLFLLLL